MYKPGFYLLGIKEKSANPANMGSTFEYIGDKENDMYDYNASFFESELAFDLMTQFETFHDKRGGENCIANYMRQGIRW